MMTCINNDVDYVDRVLYSVLGSLQVNFASHCCCETLMFVR